MSRQRINVRHGAFGGDRLELINSQHAAVAVWNWFTGGPVLGVPYTDATWTHRGTASTRPDGRAARWYSYLTRWEKLLARWVSMGTAAGLGYSYAFVSASATLAGVHYGGMVVAAVAGFYGAYRLADGAVTWSHRRNWVWPCHVVLRRLLALPEGTKPRTYLYIPENFTEISGEAIRVKVPAEWYGDDVKHQVTVALKTKLGLQDVTFSWKLAGREHYVAVTQAPRPPALVLFSDPEIRELIEKAAQDAPLIGLSHQWSPVSVSLDSESPHILVNASTGGGKSVILRALMAQFMRNGAECVILDRKRHSHKWARGLPQVEYCRDIKEIHDALVALGQEAERRNRIVDDWEGPDDEAPVGPRILLPLEEANATITKLKKYWQKIREKDDDKESPAIEALGEILFMGRAVKINVLLVAQSATANALGGPEMRENFATRILARYTRNAWNMLVPEVQPAPKATRHVGRCQVVIGGVAHETQVVFFTPEEARVWAMSAPTVTASRADTAAAARRAAPAPASPPVGAPGSWGLPSQDLRHSVTGYLSPAETIPDSHRIPAVTGDPNETIPDGEEPRRPFTVLEGGRQGEQADDAAPQLYTLAGAAREGIVKASHDALRQAKSRDLEFPKPDGKKGAYDAWYAETLQRWERNRPRTAEGGK